MLRAFRSFACEVLRSDQQLVIAGLDPAIHPLRQEPFEQESFEDDGCPDQVRAWRPSMWRPEVSRLL